MLDDAPRNVPAHPSRRPRRGFVCALVMAAALVVAPRAGADAIPDAATILQRMRSALEPGKDMRATFDLAIVNGTDSVHWTGSFYRRTGPPAKTRMVFEAPDDLRGTQVAISRDADDVTHTRIYLPLVRRVRDVQDVPGESFLGTDFTYEDLGLEPFWSRLWS